MEALKNAITDSAQRYFTTHFIDHKAVIKLHSRGYSNSRMTNYLIDQMAFDFVDQEGKTTVDSNANWEAFQTFSKKKKLMKRFLEAVVIVQNLFFGEGEGAVQDPGTHSDSRYHEHKHTKRCDVS